MAQRIATVAEVETWMETINQVQQSVATALADLARREAALADDTPRRKPAAPPDALARFDDRLRLLEARLAAVDDAAAEVADRLAAHEADTREWLDATARTRQALAAAIGGLS